MGKDQHVVKREEGFSGEGNAVFCFDDAPATGLRAWVRRELPRRRPERSLNAR
mgnify:CR=1 FL=1